MNKLNIVKISLLSSQKVSGLPVHGNNHAPDGIKSSKLTFGKIGNHMPEYKSKVSEENQKSITNQRPSQISDGNKRFLAWRKKYMNTHMQTFKKVLAPVCCLLLAALVVSGGAPADAAKADGEPAAAAEKTSDQAGPFAEAGKKVTREGLNIEFLARPVGSGGDGVAELMEGNTAEVAFRITDAETGKPVRGLYPVAYMDMAAGGAESQCKERVGLYLKGLVGIRPLIDLNSYFVMVMNQDPTISVIDPILGIQGRTNLYAQVNLKGAGADWAKTEDQKRLLVSMPAAGMVALVDLEQFKVSRNIAAGEMPARVTLQTDERYLWVGNDAKDASKSGVTVIDVEKAESIATIPTGPGHHEIALSADDRYAFVSNRDGGSVSVIDARKFKKIKRLGHRCPQVQENQGPHARPPADRPGVLGPEPCAVRGRRGDRRDRRGRRRPEGGRPHQNRTGPRAPGGLPGRALGGGGQSHRKRSVRHRHLDQPAHPHDCHRG
jgi:hypothetical protein